ncbi:phosphotransferase family enzyme [Sinobacterium caligoides]|uniref:Phosphotransferase family enzyme n=1 Tax=Sinobacterium caligoides TaxID=933926 RepID=A0A3N2E086_9GAMM|nr:phosphotransferase [Sinobacterium caligoides]ROS05523.1 phosphotransferase family enzyme [Sinobacterium caligoides]
MINIEEKEGITLGSFNSALDKGIPGIKRDDIKEVSVQHGGLFNSILKVETFKETFYYKQYLNDVENLTYNLPDIDASERAELAIKVQLISGQCNYNEPHNPVPEIVYVDHESNAFLMEEANTSQPLIEVLEQGGLSDVQLTKVSSFLAYFHKTTYNIYSDEESLSNVEFRDFKLSLQYDDIAELLTEKEASVVLKCKEKHQKTQQCVLHGDINSRNILVGKKGVSVIDFEQSHLGSPSYDVAYILSEIFISFYVHNKNSLKEKIDLFVSTYASIFKDVNQMSYEKDIAVHLAIQIIYRFLGPSAHHWTYYVSDKDKEELLNISKETLLSGSFVFETSN